MTEHRHLRITGRGDRARVELDGHEIQNGLGGLSLTMRAGDLPQLRLDPLVVTASLDYEGPVVARVVPAAHDTLVALGWTPPPDES